jgi:hypothetical protein
MSYSRAVSPYASASISASPVLHSDTEFPPLSSHSPQSPLPLRKRRLIEPDCNSSSDDDDDDVVDVDVATTFNIVDFISSAPPKKTRVSDRPLPRVLSIRNHASSSGASSRIASSSRPVFSRYPVSSRVPTSSSRFPVSSRVPTSSSRFPVSSRVPTSSSRFPVSSRVPTSSSRFPVSSLVHTSSHVPTPSSSVSSSLPPTPLSPRDTALERPSCAHEEIPLLALSKYSR